MLIPYRMETAYTRIPYSNIILVALISLIFFLIVFQVIPEENAEAFILQDWDIGQMIGSMFLHGGLFHLVGNMIFLWVFGNVVCGTVGNIAYPFLYLFLGLAGSAAHLGFDGNPALGASGAINGIVGMSLILFPANRLRCWYAFSMPFMGIMWKSGKFQTRAYWMILAWFVFDILGLVLGGGTTAHWAHIGGFAAGVIAASLLVLFKVVETFDPTLFDIIAGKPLERESYTLDEIAAMPVAATGLEGMTQVANVRQAQSSSKPASRRPPVPLNTPIPVLRVTRMAQKEKDLVIFFTNDGDPVRDVSIAAGEGSTAFIQPAKGIARREMGSMRITNLCQETLPSADLTITYAVGPEKVSKHLHYDAEKQRLVVQ